MTMFRLSARSVLPIAFLSMIICAGVMQAQGLGTVVGTVTDPSGSVIPNATVKITDEATSASRDTITNAQGYFVFPALRPAVYTSDGCHTGFFNVRTKSDSTASR